GQGSGAGEVHGADASDRSQRSDQCLAVRTLRACGDRYCLLRCTGPGAGCENRRPLAGGAGMKKPGNLLELWFTRAQDTARLMCGVSDYETYLTHMRGKHPDRTALSYEAFFTERQAARYGRGAARCC